MVPQTKLLVLCCVTVTLSSVLAVNIHENAYKGITIAFSPSVRENEINSTKLKNVLQKASEVLYLATRRRAFFSEIDFIYPSTYASACEQNAATKVQPQGISVYIASSKNRNDKSLLRAQHSKGCGTAGEVIYMSPAWLEGDEEELSRHFVQQWAIYRYGVFEEAAEPEGWTCYTYDGKLWIQNGCYSTDIAVSLVLDHNGLPSCESLNISGYNLQSSLMSAISSSKITHFCDGSKLRPHNPIAPTRHNRICRGRPVWSVIKESEDFRYGRNPPREENFTPPAVAFRCFQESTNYIIFSVQIRSKKDIEKSVDDVRLSLLRFLLFEVWPETQVSIVTVSETAETPFHLNLTEPEKVFSEVDNKVRTSPPLVSDVCLSCGLRSAFTLAKTNEGKNIAVVSVAFASALKGEDLREFIKILKTSPCRTYFIIIQDEEEDFAIPKLIREARKTGGEVFVVPSVTTNMTSPRVTTSVTIYLDSVLRNSLSIQDNIVVIHESSFFKTGGDAFHDTVKADTVLEGEMTYTLICDSDRLVVNDTVTKCPPSLPNMKDMETKIRCGYTDTLTVEKNIREWTFSYYVKTGMSPVTCSSIATVQLKTNSSNLLTVRGWMNTDTVEAGEPGKNALIIYAELMHNSMPVETAEIQAAVYSSSNSTPTIVELLDTGNGDPDIRKGDGIYSRYFTRIHTSGIHSVVIHAKGNLASYGATDVNQDGRKFWRIVPAGSFVVADQPEHIDYYPPSRIGDLRVSHIDHNDSVVTLEWTAPGDNYDDGTANRYNMRYSQTRSDLEESTFETGNSESLENVTQEIHMLPSGQLIQNITVQLPPSEENRPYYLAIQSINVNGDVSPVSNIVQIFFERSAPVRTTTTTTSTTTVVPDTSYDITSTNESIIMEFTDPNNSTAEGTTEKWENNSTTEQVINTTIVDNTTEITKITTEKPVTDRINDPCDTKFTIILASSIGGGIVALVLIINAIVCSICIRKHKRPKKLTRKASLRPPYNMSVVPREHPAATNDYSFSGPNANFPETLQDFDIDTDYTFVPGSQRMKSTNRNHLTAKTMQANVAGSSNRSLTRRFNIPQEFTDSAHSTLVLGEVRYTRNRSEDDAESRAISLGIV